MSHRHHGVGVAGFRGFVVPPQAQGHVIVRGAAVEVDAGELLHGRDVAGFGGFAQQLFAEPVPGPRVCSRQAHQGKRHLSVGLAAVSGLLEPCRGGRGVRFRAASVEMHPTELGEGGPEIAVGGTAKPGQGFRLVLVDADPVPQEDGEIVGGDGMAGLGRAAKPAHGFAGQAGHAFSACVKFAKRKGGLSVAEIGGLAEPVRGFPEVGFDRAAPAVEFGEIEDRRKEGLSRGGAKEVVGVLDIIAATASKFQRREGMLCRSDTAVRGLLQVGRRGRLVGMGAFEEDRGEEMRRGRLALAGGAFEVRQGRCWVGLAAEAMEDQGAETEIGPGDAGDGGPFVPGPRVVV